MCQCVFGQNRHVLPLYAVRLGVITLIFASMGKNDRIGSNKLDLLKLFPGFGVNSNRF